MKILIVDDEMMIKEWLKYTISGLPFEVSQIDSASNGIEALEQLRVERYDLIFIDITMPRMNGIELLKKINQEAIDAMLVVLSSHDDFQFARDAIRYNIEEYVLKNECSREKLTEILLSCQEKLANQQPDNHITREFMERVLHNNIPEKGVGIIKKSFPKIVGKIFFVASVSEEKQNIRMIYDAPRFRLKYEGMIGGIEDLTFFLFSIESQVDGHNFNFNYSGLLSEALDRRVSCGKLCRDAAEILRECRNSWIGYQSLFYSSQKHCSGRHQYREFDSITVDGHCETTIMDIRSYAKEKTLNDLKEINSYFLKTSPTDVESVINIYLVLLNTFIIYNNTKSMNVSSKLNALKATISRFRDFKLLSEWAIKMIENNSDLIDRNKYSPAVEKAIEYIELNFKEIENVLVIADHVHLSLDYFSRLFKKEVGDTLNSYLINYRLDKASIILLSSNLSIQEVAQRVGIENGSYFSKCFKKKFHTQPIQFRIQTKQSS